MGYLTNSQLKQVEDYVHQQEITFEPLRAELIDHLIGDLENLLMQEISFEKAWQQVCSQIPRNHFKTIQQETMEGINKRFNLSRGLSHLALVLLCTSAVFKMLHLPGTNLILFSAMMSIGGSLLTGSLSGMYSHREKTGRLLLMGIIGGILLFLISWFFQILAIPGTNTFRLLSVLSLGILFPVATLFFGKTENRENSLLAYLHKKHTPGIERFLAVVLVFASALKIASMVNGYPPSVSQVLLVLVMGCAGLQFFALNWHSEIIAEWKWLQWLLVIGFIAFILPALASVIPFQIRVILAFSYFLIAGFVLIIQNSGSTANKLIVGLVALFYGFWMMIQLGLLSDSLISNLLNPVTFLILLVALFSNWKQPMMKVFIMHVIAHFLFIYPETLVF